MNTQETLRLTGKPNPTDSNSTDPGPAEIEQRALRVLVRRDAGLRSIRKQYSDPPGWQRKPGFATLVRIILEQQVSLSSARATFDRLRSEISRVTPAAVLKLDDTQLRTIGFSRQKSRYARALAEAVRSKQLNLKRLETASDEVVREKLTKVVGIGNWTVDIYLLMALNRPNVWPGGDLAIAVAVQEIRNLDTRPTPEELDAIAEEWKPWRSYAARLLWHYYLSRK